MNSSTATHRQQGPNNDGVRRDVLLGTVSPLRASRHHFMNSDEGGGGESAS
jgi:hypothetical protein